MTKPKISVIMPVYKAEKYIKQAIESVLNQTFKDFELLIIDDNGKDNSMNIVRSLKDNRIIILENLQNMGIAFSRNRGLRESKGEFIALLDDDDIAIDTRLEKQLQFLTEHKNIDVVAGNAQWIDKNNKVIREAVAMIEDPEYIRVLFLFRNIFNNSEMMFRKSLINRENIYYHEECLGMEDFLFWIECSKVANMSSIKDLVLKKRVIMTNETSQVKQNLYDERRRKYAYFQKKSLEMSGFKLNDNDLNIICSMIREDGTGICTCNKEFEQFYNVLRKIIMQAKELNCSFLPQMENWFRGLIIEVIGNMEDSFLWD